MTYRIGMLAALAVGCAGEKGADSGDSGGAACPQGRYDGPVTIVEASVECLDTSTVRFYAKTEGWTDGGYVYSQDTRNEPQWSDEHDLVAYSYDACGFEDNLEQELATGRDLNNWTRNDSTVFRCDPEYHHADPVVMTYAFAVNDVDGVIADCIVDGHDPQGLIAGDYVDDAAGAAPSFELSDCRVGTIAR